MIYTPQYLREKSKIQLRSCSTPDEHGTFNTCIETDKNNFTFRTSAPLPSQHSLSIKRDGLSLQFLPAGWGEKCASNVLDFQHAAQRAGFCLTSPRALMKPAAKNKEKEKDGLLCPAQCHKLEEKKINHKNLRFLYRKKERGMDTRRSKKLWAP